MDDLREAIWAVGFCAIVASILIFGLFCFVYLIQTGVIR